MTALGSVWSSRDVLAAIEPHLDPSLVEPENLAWCQRRASALRSASSSFYLECRLFDEKRVDFLALVSQANLGSLERVSAPRAGHGWSSTAAFVHAWREPTKRLGRVPFIWLEFDYQPGTVDGGASPSPGFCVEPDYFSRFDGALPFERGFALDATAQGLSALLSGPSFERRWAAVRRCFEALPPKGALIHVSAMTARDPCKIKLYVSLPKADTLAYLRSLEWPGSPDALEAALETWYCGPQTVYLDLTVGERVEPRLGLALSQFHEVELSDFDPAWQQLPFDDVDPHKLAALRRWPEIREVTVDGARTWISCWLDIKVVLDEDGRPEPKAYLGFCPAVPPPFA